MNVYRMITPWIYNKLVYITVNHLITLRLNVLKYYAPIHLIISFINKFLIIIFTYCISSEKVAKQKLKI